MPHRRGSAARRPRSRTVGALSAEGSPARGLPRAFGLWLPLPIAVTRDCHNRPASPEDLCKRCLGSPGQLRPRLGASSERLSELPARISHNRDPTALRLGEGGGQGLLPAQRTADSSDLAQEPRLALDVLGELHTPPELAAPQGSAPALWTHCHENRAPKVWLLCSQKVFPT